MKDQSPLAIKDLPKRLSEFINDWPLYSPFKVVFADPLDYAPSLPETILRNCRKCEATPTWERRYPQSGNFAAVENYVGIGYVTAYACTHCKKEELRIWYGSAFPREKKSDGNKGRIVEVILWKFGQYPAQSIEPSREVQKEIGASNLDMFKKGLTSLTHGFGVGALAYFRRVVEDQTLQVIDLFAGVAADDGNNEAVTAIQKAKENGRTEDRLRLAAQALPDSLRPGGVNPLAVLYQHYSRGIHGLSDEECLEIAMDLDFALEYIFKNWRVQMQDAAKFKATVQRWSDSSKTPGKAG